MVRDDRDRSRGLWITPGLIECHTHLVYGGDRSNEFAARLRGATYEDIARAGGGIVSTMRATRAASEDELLEQSLPRAQALASEGVTTLEIKSGYGLDLDNELKMLRVAQRIGEHTGITVIKTFLGAHALPPEFAGRQDDYVRHVCDDMLPAVAAAGSPTPSMFSASASPSRTSRRGASSSAHAVSACRCACMPIS